MKSTFYGAVTADNGYMLIGTAWDDKSTFSRIIKVDKSGNYVWKRDLKGYSGRGLIKRKDGLYSMVSVGKKPLKSIYVVTVDSSGNIIWEFTHNKDPYYVVLDIKSSPDGGILISGKAGDSRDNNFMWILRLNSSGTLLWENKFQPGRVGRDMNSGLTCVNTLEDGKYSVLGTGDLNINQVAPFLWLAQLDEDGIIETERKISIGFNRFYRMLDTGFGYVVCGGFSRDRDKKSDMCALYLNYEGEIIGNASIGGNGNEIARDIVRAHDGGFILAGLTSSSGGVGRGVNGTKYFIAKVNEEKEFEWYKTISVDNYNEWNSLSIRQDLCRAVVRTEDRGYLLVGHLGNGGNNRYMWAVKIDEKGNFIWDNIFDNV